MLHWCRDYGEEKLVSTLKKEILSGGVLVERRGRAGAARLAEVISVDLPQAIAANAVVDIGAVGRLIVGDAKHIGLVGRREVPIDHEC